MAVFDPTGFHGIKDRAVASVIEGAVIQRLDVDEGRGSGGADGSPINPRAEGRCSDDNVREPEARVMRDKVCEQRSGAVDDGEDFPALLSHGQMVDGKQPSI